RSHLGLRLRGVWHCRHASPPDGERYNSFFFSSRRRHTRSVSAFLLNRSSDLLAFSTSQRLRTTRASARTFFTFRHYITPSARNFRSEERFSRNAETDLVCRLLLEKKKKKTENQNLKLYRIFINALTISS